MRSFAIDEPGSSVRALYATLGEGAGATAKEVVGAGGVVLNQ